MKASIEHGVIAIIVTHALLLKSISMAKFFNTL